MRVYHSLTVQTTLKSANENNCHSWKFLKHILDMFNQAKVNFTHSNLYNVVSVHNTNNHIVFFKGYQFFFSFLFKVFDSLTK